MNGSVSNSAIILLFQRLRWQSVHNGFRVVREHSLLRALSIVLCSAVVWCSLFALSYLGFRELRERFNFPIDGRLLGFLFDTMFFALTVLLIFSTGIILYTSLFTSGETAFLLSTPMPAEQVFAYKLQGAIAFSSWGFVLLGSPFLLTYGLIVDNGASWIFYPCLLLFFTGFVLIPGTIGGLLSLIVVNVLPRHRRQLLLIVGLGMLLLLGILGWRWLGMTRGIQVGTRDWFTTILRELKPLQSQWMPSHWIAHGLQAAALGQRERAVFYLALVWSNGLLWYTGTVWLSKWLYRRGYNRIASGGTLRKKFGGHWLDRCLSATMFFIDGQTRLLVIKDFRTFRRDPAQWFQVVIFLQLAVLYFYSVRQYFAEEIGRPFQNGISLLTLLAISFLICAYMGRFIFPLLSLEGRKFWILGLLPLSRDRLMWGKFLFATAGSLVTAEFLGIFSDLMLLMPWQIIVVHSLTIAILSCTLSGVSVGLGACMPNFRENDPSKIAVGLAGTLNLVACLLVLMAVVLLMAVPWHLHIFFDPMIEGDFPWWAYPGLLLGAALGLGISFLTMRAGIRALRGMEF